jgi:hypothetical protein
MEVTFTIQNPQDLQLLLALTERLGIATKMIIPQPEKTMIKPTPVENIALLESIRKFKGVLKSKTGYIPQKNEFYEQ